MALKELREFYYIFNDIFFLFLMINI